MKREDAEILIESEKTQQTALSQITSTSAAGVWTQLKFVFASMAEWLYNQWEGFRDEIETLVNTRRWATVAWYIEKAKAFQLGDMLELQPSGQFGYTEIDPAKQIIKQAAIDVVDRELRLKVATEENGELAKVSDADMELFKSYIFQIMRPGTQIRFIKWLAGKFYATGPDKATPARLQVADGSDPGDAVTLYQLNNATTLTITDSPTEPTNPVEGQIWVDSTL